MKEATMSESEIRNIVCKTGKQLLKDSLAVRTWGNVSHRLDKEHMIITPSGKLYEELEAEYMVKVNLKTFKVVGKYKPSSEFKMHAGIYKHRKNISAIIHTHQVNASVLPSVLTHSLPPLAHSFIIKLDHSHLPFQKILRGRFGAIP